MLQQVLDAYVETHHKKPKEIILTPHAALALSAKSRLMGTFNGVPLRCDCIDGDSAVPKGTGSRVGLFVKDTGVQQTVAVVELR
jgi:hypothetical protein